MLKIVPQSTPSTPMLTYPAGLLGVDVIGLEFCLHAYERSHGEFAHLQCDIYQWLCFFGTKMAYPAASSVPPTCADHMTGDG